MASPKSTVWKLDPHTIAKHTILKRYLDAWFPILSTFHGRIVYYDGFAGPGVYSEGQDGSPVIALKAAKEHRAKLDSELVFIFAEKSRDRARKLEEVVSSLDLPANFKWEVKNEGFEEALGSTLDYLDKENLLIAPTFALIDPFGITGLPFSLVERLLSRKRCEVFITFMDSAIKRFVNELPTQVDDLIGHDSASKMLSKTEPSARITVARQLYEQSLKRVARYVRFFEMRNAKGQVIYDLFFATNNELGHYKMKEAMWKTDDLGGYSFSDGVDPQQSVLFSREPEQELAVVIWDYFEGKVVLTEEVLRFGRDETAYLEKHVRGALGLLEVEGRMDGRRILVAEKKADGRKRRKGTFPHGVSLEFVPGQKSLGALFE